jgi:hypothetical protein
MKDFVLFTLLTAYIVWTLAFAIKFNKTDNYFDKGQKRIHNVLIWLVPFIWIMIIKTITKPTPGSANYNKTDKGSFSESGIGIWSQGQDSSSGQSDHH